MTEADIVQRLVALQDGQYRRFQAALLPTVPAERIIGVRTPELRALSRKVAADGPGAEMFLSAVPHRFFEEDQLHAFIIARERDFSRCVARVDSFLPFVDNWATCDQLLPASFRRNPGELLPHVRRWLSDGREYTVRFAIGCLMRYYRDNVFFAEAPALVAAVGAAPYYVRMMAAWYFATVLDGQYEAVIPYLTERRLDPWTHNKAIQKAVESRRIPPETKAYLRTLKVPVPPSDVPQQPSAILDFSR